MNNFFNGEFFDGDFFAEIIIVEVPKYNIGFFVIGPLNG